jgi:SNF2 family DNA or RNA helicase
MKFSPRPYQQTAIDRMVERRCQLLALRMGTGKTAVTLTAIQQFKYKQALVVAPKRVAELVWHAEALKWDHTTHLKIERVLGTPAQRIDALSRAADGYVINRENLLWLIKHYGDKWPFDVVIFDENVGLKDKNSKTWKEFKKIRPLVNRIYILTGTPAPNSLEELWPQVSLMDYGKRLGRSLTAYRDEYFTPDKRNGHIVYSYRLKPGAADRIYEKLGDIMLSVESDIELPDRIDNIVPVIFDMARYEEMVEEMISGEIIATSAGVLAGKLGQMANGAVYDEDRNVHVIHTAKLDALQEIVDQGEPVLCFTAYQHDQLAILHRFPDAVVFDGEPSLKAWQAGNIRLLIMHPRSGGHGVDGLQVGGNVACWYGLPFSLDLYEQANARLHRSGQKNQVVVHHLVSVGTIDQRIMRVLETKGNMQQALLDAVKELKNGAN